MRPPAEGEGSDFTTHASRALSASGAPGSEVILVYMVMAITIGAIVSHILSRIAPWLPYTPTLLVIGVLTSIFGQFSEDCCGAHIYRSFELWEAIDGHLLLFIFLPPLLFADSMNLQWNLIRRCLAQCALLAGPGVVMGAVLNGLFAKFVLPYNWSWPICWSYGAVQAATDPVAVVALLNQLGASPSLTMIISGESLLNDGTAIVMWSFFFGQAMGEQSRNLFVFLAKLVLGGFGVGLVRARPPLTRSLARPQRAHCCPLHLQPAHALYASCTRAQRRIPLPTVPSRPRVPTAHLALVCPLSHSHRSSASLCSIG